VVTVIDPNIVDWQNLSALISSIPQLFPGVIAMVVGILPLIFIGMVIGLVVGLFGAIIDIVQNVTKFFK
jgi:flagellar biosynthesis protein FliQ